MRKLVAVFLLTILALTAASCGQRSEPYFEDSATVLYTDTLLMQPLTVTDANELDAFLTMLNRCDYEEVSLDAVETADYEMENLYRRKCYFETESDAFYLYASSGYLVLCEGIASEPWKSDATPVKAYKITDGFDMETFDALVK